MREERRKDGCIKSEVPELQNEWRIQSIAPFFIIFQKRKGTALSHRAEQG